MSIFIQAHGTIPSRTAVCITKDGSISYYRPNQNGRIKDQATGKMVDYFYFVQNQTLPKVLANIDSNHDYRYMITLDRFQNIKVFKYSKNKNKWIKIDG